MSTRRPTRQPSAPTAESLREAALRHLARYGCTAASLTRVLERRVDRWARSLPAEDGADAARDGRRMVRSAVARLVEQKLVDDAAFAAARAGSLLRAGRSGRAVEAHLAVRGIGRELQREVVPEDATRELAAALVLLRKRRLGAFAEQTMTPEAKMRALGMLARAGFAQPVARRALATEREEALSCIARLREA